MKISTSLKHGMAIAGVSVRESARMMKNAGFDGVDLNMCAHQTEPEKLLAPAWRETLLSQAAALREEGLEIAQCHLPFYPGHLALPGDGSFEAFESFMLPSCIRALEVCGEIDCHVAVMHPFFTLESADITHDGNLRIIEKIMPLLEKYDIRLALENIYGLEYANSNVSFPEDILRILEKADSPRVGACIDTGHANIFRINIADMARMYGPRLFALHVNGNAGQDAHAIPYSMSGWCENMDFHAFSAALKGIGYSGYYNLELNTGDMPASAAQAFLNFAAAVGRALADEAE